MFGWNNIYVIDNYSVDGTYEVINKFNNLINISREHEYKKKGEYMKNLISRYCSKEELAFPINIDEFIVYYDNNTINIDKDLINHYLNTLPVCRIYKANYIYGLITCKNGFSNALKEIDY